MAQAFSELVFFPNPNIVHFKHIVIFFTSQDAVLPLSAAAMALPPLSIRGDWGVLSTAAARYAPSLFKSFLQMGPRSALGATKLLRPFSEILDDLQLKDPFVRNWIDLLSFLLAGVKANSVLSAEMVANYSSFTYFMPYFLLQMTQF